MTKGVLVSMSPTEWEHKNASGLSSHARAHLEGKRHLDIRLGLKSLEEAARGMQTWNWEANRRQERVLGVQTKLEVLRTGSKLAGQDTMQINAKPGASKLDRDGQYYLNYKQHNLTLLKY